MHNYLDFEKPISDLEGKILELKTLAEQDESVDTSDEIARLEVRARDATAEGGVITVSAANRASDGTDLPSDLAAGVSVVVTVRDTGSGMSPEVLARVLEPRVRHVVVVALLLVRS